MKPALNTHLVLLAAAAFTGNASAQARDEVPPLSIRVTGEARVTAPPDQAEIDVGVITRGETARRAADQNARETARVLAELNKHLEGAGGIQTVGYSVHPEYRYPREGREPQISGYVATNVVRVTVTNLDRVGDIVDIAVGAGANRIQRIRFMLKDQEAVYHQALGQAADRAEAEANALASALGLRVVRVFSAAEESAPVRPFVDAPRTAALAAESTPVEPGTVDVDARVLLTVEVSGAQ
jgi:uncharacterized protein YggE